jgi:predicted anti-sigma-YlaC factor YlaD
MMYDDFLSVASLSRKLLLIESIRWSQHRAAISMEAQLHASYCAALLSVFDRFCGLGGLCSLVVLVKDADS